VRQALARHPVIAATLLGCALLGAAIGYFWLSGDWSAARRIGAGAVAGAGIAILVTGTKIFD
jgi:hypothetical protein